MNPKLECGNKVYNSSLTASITYTGKMDVCSRTCTCMQQLISAPATGGIAAFGINY